jgi:hypothetical protein
MARVQAVETTPLPIAPPKSPAKWIIGNRSKLYFAYSKK